MLQYTTIPCNTLVFYTPQACDRGVPCARPCVPQGRAPTEVHYHDAGRGDCVMCVGCCSFCITLSPVFTSYCHVSSRIASYSRVSHRIVMYSLRIAMYSLRIAMYSLRIAMYSPCIVMHRYVLSCITIVLSWDGVCFDGSYRIVEYRQHKKEKKEKGRKGEYI